MPGPSAATRRTSLIHKNKNREKRIKLSESLHISAHGGKVKYLSRKSESQEENPDALYLGFIVA